MRFSWILPHLGMFGSIREVIELSNALSDHSHQVVIHTKDGEPCQWLHVFGEVRKWDDLLDDEYDLTLLVTDWRRAEYDMLLSANTKHRGIVLMGFDPSKDTAKRFNGWPYAPEEATDVLVDALHNEDILKFADGAWQLDWVRINVGCKTAVSLGGVNSKMFHPSENNEVIIGASGDPRERKGLDTVLEAASIIEKATGKKLQTYWGKYDQEGLVEFLQQVTVFLDGHRRAGWCNPVLEAMACGAVPVCTDIGATNFVIDGGNGRRVPVNSSKRMADAALWYLGSAPRIVAHRENAIRTARALDYHNVATRLVRFLGRL